MPATTRTLTTVKSCPCKPDFTFSSTTAYNNHKKSARHQAYETGLEHGRREMRYQFNNSLEMQELYKTIERLKQKCNGLTEIVKEDIN